MYGIQRLCRRRRQSPVLSPDRGFLVLALVLFIGIRIAEAVTRPREFLESRMEAIGSRYCDFSSSDRIYNITDMLQCMNELASTAVAHSRIGRSSEDRAYSLPSSRRVQPYPSANYQYPPRQSNDYQTYYDRRPIRLYSGPNSYQAGQSGYYDGGFKYPYPTEQPSSFPGGASTGLLDALASISQYDDLKCVPRILCEFATGVIPGNSGYKQNYDGGNSLINLLTGLDIGESSPLLMFGKSALTGYTSRGNPSVCYREYPKCPRSNAELVNYLNNHNGGFFRFFGNARGPQPNYYRGPSRREPAPPPGITGSEADRTGTGELKFDSSTGLLSREFIKSFFPDRREFNDSDKITFPQEPLQGEQSLNRVSKSLMGYQDSGNDYQNPSFFPQDRKDPESNMLYASNPLNQPQSRSRSSQISGSPKARLYLPDDPTNETISMFTFPDGQKVRINVAFSKLFSESYKKALRRSFGNDHSPQPVNFEGFSMVNLAELYQNDRSRLDLQVVHPCDMICHDSKGTPVQFNQILLHSGSLSTLMAPDQPILDLSNSVPCEIMCIDRRGERRQLSTILNQVLRTGYDRQPGPDTMGFQDNWENRDYRSLNQPHRLRKSQNRKVRENIEQSRQQSRHIREQRNDYELPDIPPKDHGTYSQSQSHAPKPRDIGQTENKANSINAGDNAASVPQGSILFGGGPMPFFGSPIPFMGMADLPQGSPAFFPPGSSGPLGLAIQSMPMPMPMPMPMQPDNGMIQSLGMMPIFPGIMPMMDPLAGGMVPILPVSPPPTIVCSGPVCPTGPQSPQKVLMMCGGVLYFIPYEIVLTLPVCAVFLESGGDSSESKPGSQDSEQTTTSSASQTSTMPSRGEFTTLPESIEENLITTTHKFRQPEGEDYPQQSCLEGESWNLDMHECVPIKYDPEIEMDYTHLPGSPWSGVTRKPIKTHKLKKRKKLVIITDKGNITYIKAA